MNKFLSIVATSVVVALTGTAFGLTLTNTDGQPHTLLIVEDDSASRVVIQPGQTVRNLCSEGCRILLGDGARQSFEGDEVVYLKNGQLVVEE